MLSSLDEDYGSYIELNFGAILPTGNAAIGRNKNDTFLSNYRSGILLHTGEWENWNTSEPMPNRYCIIDVLLFIYNCF